MADIKTLHPSASGSSSLKALAFWHQVVSRSLKNMQCDLSARQTGIMLTVYLMPPPHSIKSLAEELQISKPAVCRAIDALEQMKFVKRVRDAKDKRNVLIQRTVKGSVYLSDLAEIIMATSKDVA